MKKRIITLLFILVAMTALFTLTSCKDKNNGDDKKNTVTPPIQSDLEPTPTSAPVDYTEPAVILNIKAEDYVETRPDSVKTEGEPNTAWWANWPRYSGNGSAAKIDDVDADVATCSDNTYDDGTGSAFMPGRKSAATVTNMQFETFGKKTGAWIEGIGDARNVIVAVRKNADGYILSDQSGMPDQYKNHWSWFNGFLPVEDDTTEIHWASIQAFVNNETWLGHSIIANTDVPLPTYPDGREAVGYINDIENPVYSRLYDACGSKDLNGDFVRTRELYADEGSEDQIYFTDSEGNRWKNGDFSIGKDDASPFWNEYARWTTRNLMDIGVDSFWVDNHIGWDSLSNNPLHKGFGEWTKASVVTFINEHPELGVSTIKTNEDLVDYIRNKFLEINPDGDPMNINSNSTWQSDEWMKDPVWRAYLTVKSNNINAASHGLYNVIKEEAAKLGKNPDDISVTGNDFCLMHFAAVDGQQLDLVSTEYGPDFNVITGTNYDGLPPMGRPAGVFSMLGQSAKGKHASVWYYPHDTRAAFSLGKVLGYYALSHNVTINQGADNRNIVGTDRSAKEVNRAIGSLRDYFGNRERYAEIGVLYSSESEMIQLAPGGWVYRGEFEAALGYLSWCNALEELQIPFRSIDEINLEKWIDELSVLIMPGTVAIRQSTVDNVLKKFLDNGGTLIVTGENAGTHDTKAGIYAPYEKSILIELCETYSGAGKTIYLDYDISIDAYKMKKYSETPADFAAELKPIKEIFDSLLAEGRINELLTISDFGEYVYTTLNFDPYTKSFFVDITNMNIDLDTEVITSTSGKIRVKMPKELTGKDIEILTYNDVQKTLRPATGAKVNGGYIEYEISEFECYTTVMFVVKS